MAKSAQIQYAGIAGVSKDCQNAVMRFIQFGDTFEKVRVLTAGNGHAFLLTLGYGDVVAIKSGFSSGYGGEGPRTFSETLATLFDYNVDIDEYEVEAAVIRRLDDSALTVRDLELIDKKPPVRPSRWGQYIFESHWIPKGRTATWAAFPLVLPLAAIDSRIADLAMRFPGSEDQCLMEGYRRLEDLIRQRTGLEEHGSKLFAKAFQGENPYLTWKKLDSSELVGRGQLFAATFMAFRNPRAHRTLPDHSIDRLNEFLLLNHLYALEAKATLRTRTEERPHAQERPIAPSKRGKA